MPQWSVAGKQVYPKGENPLDNDFYGYQVTELLLPNGQPARYHGIDVGDCVHVVAVEPDETTYLVRQKRPNVMAIGAKEVPETLELPGGFADPAKSLEDSAQEEI